MCLFSSFTSASDCLPPFSKAVPTARLRLLLLLLLSVWDDYHYPQRVSCDQDSLTRTLTRCDRRKRKVGQLVNNDLWIVFYFFSSLITIAHQAYHSVTLYYDSVPEAVSLCLWLYFIMKSNISSSSSHSFFILTLRIDSSISLFMRVHWESLRESIPLFRVWNMSLVLKVTLKVIENRLRT